MDNTKFIKNNISNFKDEDSVLYVNYQFCVNKCKYCIYHIDKYSPDKSKTFLKYLKKEADIYSKFLSGKKFKEIHIGGGTPNLVQPEMLMGAFEKLADFNKIKNFVLEIFPNQNLEKYLQNLMGYGVTKVILGVQSLNQNILQNENRLVRVETIKNNFEILKNSGLSWSVDLIYGLGGNKIDYDYISELKQILVYEPSGFHLYNIRSQQENNFYKKSLLSKRRIKYMDVFDFEKISNILIDHNYKIIGDEWCLQSDKNNSDLAKKDDLFFGEPNTLGIGVWARGRNRRFKYRNTKRLNEYKKMLDDRQLPVTNLFDYQNKYFLIANLLLSVNQSSSFNLKKIFSIPSVTDIEKAELITATSLFKRNGINIKTNGDEFLVPRAEYSRAVKIIEGYLKRKSGQEYFYKN